MGISKVVVRYLDGGIVEGFTQNFSPDKDSFHLYANPSFSGSPKEVLIKELKALFFVREFAGDSKYQERKKYAPGENPSGRKVEVRFKDGEIMAGSSLAFDRRRKGFFLFPADPKGNNLKIFVVFATVETISKVNPP